MANEDVKSYMRSMKVTYRQLSEQMGVSDAAVYRWMRIQLTADKKAQIISSIREVVKRRNSTQGEYFTLYESDFDFFNQLTTEVKGAVCQCLCDVAFGNDYAWFDTFTLPTEESKKTFFALVERVRTEVGRNIL